jgi:hypothetical protein
VVELSDRIKMQDGSFARGFIFTDSRSTAGGGTVTTNTNVAITRTGPVPYGKLTFREDSKIVQKDGVTIFGDISTENGKSVPVSISIRKQVSPPAQGEAIGPRGDTIRKRWKS